MQRFVRACNYFCLVVKFHCEGVRGKHERKEQRSSSHVCWELRPTARSRRNISCWPSAGSQVLCDGILYFLRHKGLQTGYPLIACAGQRLAPMCPRTTVIYISEISAEHTSYMQSTACLASAHVSSAIQVESIPESLTIRYGCDRMGALVEKVSDRTDPSQKDVFRFFPVGFLT